MSPGQDETRVCGYILFIITIIAEKAFRRCFSGEWGGGGGFQFCYAVVLQEHIGKGTLF